MVEELQTQNNTPTEQADEKIGNFDPNDLNIPTVEAKKSIDVTQYEGTRIKIGKVVRDIVESHYVTNEDTGEREYNPNKTEPQDVIFVETEPLAELTDAEGNKKPLVVRQRFNLQKDSEGNVVISKHEKAALWKFMRKMGVTDVKNLVGKFVTITTEPDRNDETKRWLRIVQ